MLKRCISRNNVDFNILEVDAGVDEMLVGELGCGGAENETIDCGAPLTAAVT